MLTVWQYDMMTSPISTPAYRVKVQELVDDYLLTVLEDESVDAESVPMPLVPPLTPEYTTLTPDETISSLLMTTSPWIDLASSDPAIAHVSRQVFNQEVAYAAFCGVNNIMVPGPNYWGERRLTAYARAITQALGTGPYVQLQIVMPMSQDIKEGKPEDPQHFVHKARVDYREDGDGVNPVSEAYGSWDAWDLIRSTCRYHGRLSVCKSLVVPSLSRHFLTSHIYLRCHAYSRHYQTSYLEVHLLQRMDGSPTDVTTHSCHNPPPTTSFRCPVALVF